MGYKRTHSEDPEYVASASVKRFKATGGSRKQEEPEPLPSSSAPASPRFDAREDTPVPDFSHIGGDVTPPQNSPGLPPLPSSAASILQSPKKKSRGRPRGSTARHNPAGSHRPRAAWSNKTERQQAATAAERAVERFDDAEEHLLRKAEVKAAKKAADQRQEAERLRDEAHRVYRLITQDKADGGFGFDSMRQFVDALFMRQGDSQVAANLTRLVRDHGNDFARKMDERSPGALNDFISDKIAQVLSDEGKKIQQHLARNNDVPITNLLSTFSVEKHCCRARNSIYRVEEDPHFTPHQVFATICAMIAVLRSQRSNNFQTVIGLFLLGSGAAKRQIEVLSHAGLSTSYNSIMDHIKGQ